MGLRPAVSVNRSDAVEMAPALTAEPVASHQNKLTAESSPTTVDSLNQEEESVLRNSTKSNTTTFVYSYKKPTQELISEHTFELAFNKTDNSEVTDSSLNGLPISSDNNSETHMDQISNITNDSKILQFDNSISGQQDGGLINDSPSVSTATNVENNFTPEQIVNNNQEVEQDQQHNDMDSGENCKQIKTVSDSEEQRTVEQYLEQLDSIFSAGSSSCQNNQNPLINNNTMGLQKDFSRHNDMEQMLGELATSNDIDLLQVLKNFETNQTGENLCDLDVGLSLFNDVDVMNMGEDAITPCKQADTQEMRAEIIKRQAQMQRKCDFLLRRLRKIQAFEMGQHVSEEVAGLFEYTQRLLKRKDRKNRAQHGVSKESMAQILQDELNEKQKPLTVNSMKTLIKRIDQAANLQQTSISSTNPYGYKRAMYGEVSNKPQLSSNKIQSLVPTFDVQVAQQLEQCSGLMQSGLRFIETTIDSDATVSSSGGESADEFITFTATPTEQPGSIVKRAGYKWARDRAAIAARWSWLLAQISDLEYRIRQHNELHRQIKKNKGAVTFEDVSTSAIAVGTNNQLNGYRGSAGASTSKLADSLTTDQSEAAEKFGASRTRPFQRSGFRKRKLLQTANLHTISKKAARPSTVKCGCQWPLQPCALCTGRQDPVAPRDLPDTMPISTRVALLDPCFHPVLSFPEDVSHGIHFESTMRIPDWQTKASRSTTKSAMKGSLSSKSNDRIEKSNKSHKKLNILDSKRKYSKKFGLLGDKIKKATKKNGQGFMGSTSKFMKMKSKQKGGAASGSDSPAMHFDADGNPINGAIRSKNSSPTPTPYKHEKYGSERRSNRNSYDIDNIVIPYSVAAATRVEIIPYKEIPTPKWRVVESDEDEKPLPVKSNESKKELDNNKTEVTNKDEVQKESEPPSEEKKEDETKSDETTTKDSKEEVNIGASTSSTPNGVVQNEDEEEDISDETIHLRHERALAEERKKFATYLKFPFSTRSRANRRIDSRAESSGANTPDPTSPAPNPAHVTGDQESIPSPAAVTTPLSAQSTDAIENPMDKATTESTSATVSTAGTPITTPRPPTFTNGLTSNPNKRLERKRTISVRRERSLIENLRDDFSRSNTPDLIEPFEPLKFPLSDDIFNAMIDVMPVNHQNVGKNESCGPEIDAKNRAAASSSSSSSQLPVKSQSISLTKQALLDHPEYFPEFEPDSDAETESAESGIPDEDPNDPEWQNPVAANTTLNRL